VRYQSIFGLRPKDPGSGSKNKRGFVIWWIVPLSLSARLFSLEAGIGIRQLNATQLNATERNATQRNKLHFLETAKRKKSQQQQQQQ